MKMDNNFEIGQIDNKDLKDIHQFLLDHNFKNAAAALIAEASAKGFESFEESVYENDQMSPSNTYEKMMSTYKSGDWKSFFTLWNSVISDDDKSTEEYKTLTLNLHVHFAVLPKRILLAHWYDKKDKVTMDTVTSMISLHQNNIECKERENFMTEVEKSMSSSMEQLREYLDTAGKELEHDTKLRPFFALPFIEDPYSEPFLSKIFEESWLVDLTENLHRFISRYKNSHCEDETSHKLSSHNGSSSEKLKNGSNADVVRKAVIKNNVPIVPNDRNIPGFIEDNEIEENRSIGTRIDDIQLPTNSSSDTCSLDIVKNDKRLIQCTQELALTKSHLCTVHSNYEKLKLRFHKLHADYHRLISIAGELTATLENSVKGGNVDLQAMLETCIKIFPDLFNQNIRDSSQFSSVSQLDDSHTIEHRMVNILPISPKLLDFKKIKWHLINGTVKSKLLLLQALRRKITLGQPGERDEAIHEYISRDLLGLHGQIASDNGKSILPYLLKPSNIIMPHPLQQSAARFLNVLASFRCGRDYLSFGSTVVNVIFKCLNSTFGNETDTFTCNMMIAMLQKLSLRKQQRIYMIEHGLVEWLLRHLHDHCHVMDPYRLEYATALLMNLSLHRIAQRRVSTDASFLISTLLILLLIDNTSALPYVNGALNNFLSNHTINEEAKKMKLSSILDHYREHKTGQIREHLDHILKILRGEDTVNTEGDDTADDDNEEYDVLENELEENDPVKSYTGELCGEALLAACYSISPKVVQERNTLDVPSFKYSKLHSAPMHDNQQEDVISYHERESATCKRNVLPRSVNRSRGWKNKNKIMLVQTSTKKPIEKFSFVQLHEEHNADTLRSKRNKDESMENSCSRNMRSQVNSLDKTFNKSAVCLYENQISKESSKTTLGSSTVLTVASEDEPTAMEKLSSIASFRTTNGNKGLADSISWGEETELDRQEAFSARPKLPRTPP